MEIRLDADECSARKLDDRAEGILPEGCTEWLTDGNTKLCLRVTDIKMRTYMHQKEFQEKRVERMWEELAK